MMILTYSKPNNLSQLHDEILQAVPALRPQDGVPVMTVSGSGNDITLGVPDGTDVPPVDAVVAAHVPKLAVIECVERQQLNVLLRTTDDLEHTVFVIPAAPKSIYRAELEMSALDAGNGACKFMAGILVWKRLVGASVIAPPNNITVLSQINDTAAASWVMNGLPQGGSFRIFVKGAAGRTIDWTLGGSIARYAPEGLT